MTKKSLADVDKKVLRFFSAIADETRLKILNALMNSSLTVGEIYKIAGRESMTLSAVSHQLKYLEQVGIVVFEKKGREKLFSLSEDFCWCILRDAYNHFGKQHGCTECKKSKGNR